MDPNPTDQDRFPLLDDTGAAMLKRLREHAHVPRFNFACGDRLSASGLANVRAFAARMKSHDTAWQHGSLPAWLPPFIERCRRDVPFYRRQADWSDDFFSLPRLERSSIRKEAWSLVPDPLDLSEIITYYTSGTAGDRMHMPSHPEVASRYLPLLQATLAAHGVTLAGGGSNVSIVRVSWQEKTFTYPSVISYLHQAGFAKINLNPADWNHPLDPIGFLDDINPELYTGDSIALTELARLPLKSRPKALISSGTALLPGMKANLEERFGVPVIDLYSLCEFGPIAHTRPGGAGHEILPWELYVEVLNDAGEPCPPGERGEIVLTGELNPYLPMIRYRTGDYGSLDFTGTRPVLIGLEGRAPTVFRTHDGRPIHGIDVSIALGHLPLPMLSLRQRSDGSMVFRTRCDAGTMDQAEAALRRVFGERQAIALEQVPDDEAWTGKLIQYAGETSEVR